jgi:MIP family channel proteins
MSFHPSPSIDCHTTPMEVQLPFIQEAMNNQDYTRNNGIKSTVDDTTRSRSPSNVGKLCCDYHTSSGQYIFRCPPSRFRKSLYADELLCISQIATTAFYQALFTEFLGTMLLTLICTSTGLPITNKSVPDLHGALVAGFVIATMVVGFGHISGAHINPAVTVSFLVACEIDIIRALCYIGMQLLGAISGSCILKFLAPSHSEGNLGVNTITEGVTTFQAVIVEFIITFILCYTVHAICDKQREDIGGSKALAVGLAIIVGCLFGGPYTGASMNPARSFGPATVMNSWKNHWVYWLGPLTGSIVAAIMYTYVLKQQPPIVVRTDSRRRSVSFLGKPNFV